jgi:hypothetical protein
LRISPTTWAQTDHQKATAFAKHLTSIFQPFPSQLTQTEEDSIHNELLPPHQIVLPLKKIRVGEVKSVIQFALNSKKAPGYDLINGNIIKELSPKGLKALTQIYAILRLEYFPSHWKIGQIIMIAKPGKNPNDITSYRPISLLPTLSQILEKLILKRLLHIIEEFKIIPSQQFGFRRKHGTTEQVHSLVHTIHSAMEYKQYCSAVFLDISQAFDKVWHTRLLYKLKRTLPHPEYTLLKSYLSDRMFQVRYQEEYTPLHTIHSGVP